MQNYCILVVLCIMHIHTSYINSLWELQYDFPVWTSSRIVLEKPHVSIFILKSKKYVKGWEHGHHIGYFILPTTVCDSTIISHIERYKHNHYNKIGSGNTLTVFDSRVICIYKLSFHKLNSERRLSCWKR